MFRGNKGFIAKSAKFPIWLGIDTPDLILFD